MNNKFIPGAPWIQRNIYPNNIVPRGTHDLYVMYIDLVFLFFSIYHSSSSFWKLSHSAAMDRQKAVLYRVVAGSYPGTRPKTHLGRVFLGKKPGRIFKK